jgi:hypothetical protein
MWADGVHTFVPNFLRLSVGGTVAVAALIVAVYLADRRLIRNAERDYAPSTPF